MSLIPSLNDPIVRIPHCLADEVRRIEETNDTPEEYKTLFEQWRSVHLVDDVLKGNRTFEEAYNNVTAELDGINLCYPSSFPEKLREDIEDLEKTVGMIGVKEEDVKLANVTAMTAMATVAGAVTSPVYAYGIAKDEKRKPRRRDFLAAIGISTVFGGATGILASGIRGFYLMQQQENAMYLDTKIKEFYNE